MKVGFIENYKKFFTLENMENAKQIIKDMKEYESTPAEDVKYAIDEYLNDENDYCVEVLKASAEICKNYRAHNVFNETSNDLDIVITAIAKTARGYIEISAYISDIWQTGAKHYKHHIYAKYFTENEK